MVTQLNTCVHSTYEPYTWNLSEVFVVEWTKDFEYTPWQPLFVYLCLLPSTLCHYQTIIISIVSDIIPRAMKGVWCV